MTPSPTLTPWPGDEPPARDQIEASFRQMTLTPSWWSNGPGDTYATHSHSYHKLLFCARGTIEFAVEPNGDRIELKAGDRLDIPPGVVHSTVVGPDGVACVEAARSG